MKWDLAHERWEVGDDDLKFGPVQSIKIPGPLQHTVGVICAPCNGGWIADLETEVRPILDDLRKTERVTLSRRHQHTLAAWSVLTAMVTEHTVPDLAIPAGDYHHLCKTGKIPARFMVWISKQNQTFRVATRAGALAIHVLGSGQQDLAVLFGTRTGDDVDKFALCRWHEGDGTHSSHAL